MPNPQPRPRYRLFDDVDELRLGLVGEVRGFFAGSVEAESWFDESDDEMPYARFDVLGLAPDPPLRAAIDAAGDEEYGLGEISVEILADDGEPIGFYQLLTAELERTWRTADGTLNATVAGWLPGSIPHVDAGRVWDTWRAGPPASRNLWAALPVGRREAWLEVVSNYRPNDPLRRGEHGVDAAGRPEVVLDGRHVADLSSFFCAIGEAVNGPGGYFGSNPMALTDCLAGGWGVSCPFTLVWEESAVARAHLAEPAYLEMLLGVFRQAGTDVVLR
jgi:hypothetical protein